MEGCCYYYFAISNDNVSFGTCFRTAISDSHSLIHKKTPQLRGFLLRSELYCASHATPASLALSA